jgi:hypothetical protein
MRLAGWLLNCSLDTHPWTWIIHTVFPENCVCPYSHTFLLPDWIVAFFLVSLGGVRLSPLGTSATAGLLYQPRMIDDDDYGAVGGMRIGSGNRSTRRKPAPVPQIPPDLGSNPGRRGGKPATNRLSYGAAVLPRVKQLDAPVWNILFTWTITEQAGLAVTSRLVFGRCSVRRILAKTPAILTCFSWSLSALLGKCQDGVPIWPRPLPSKFFPIHHTSVILSFSII